ncbi:MAG: FAD-dependent oxidoreductase, partial [Chloroflexota bacterium]
TIDVGGDLDRLEGELKALSPDDAKTVDWLLSGARALRGSSALYEMGMGKPPELLRLTDRMGQMWGMRRVARYLSGGYARPMADCTRTVREPTLRKVLENLFLPEAPAWLGLSILALAADRQLGLLEGGCLDFVLPMEKRYRDLGGRVTYKATVERILVEDGRAVGVNLADGSEHRADTVVSAADGHSTLFVMLGGRYLGKKAREQYQSWKPVRPVVMVSYGVARAFTDAPPLNTIFLKNALTVGGQSVPGISLRLFNYSSKFAPPGKTVVQAMFETEWEFWNELQKDRPRYEAEKVRVAAEVLRRLEAHYPGISSQVEVSDVATPYTTWRYTLNHQGAYMGWLPTPEALMAQMPRTLPGLANFYMAGQWASGGGVPPSLLSGRHAIQLLCHRDRKPFRTATP